MSRAQGIYKRYPSYIVGCIIAVVLVSLGIVWSVRPIVGSVGENASSFDLEGEGPIQVDDIPEGVVLTREQFERIEFPIQRTEQEWRALLEEKQYQVLRQRETERAYSGKYDRRFREGTYHSAATGQPLFSSAAKYESHTGWPSYFEPIDPRAVLYVEDHSLILRQIEIVDSKSGSHLGHVFDDGPEPSGRRYCMNSAALVFVPEGEHPPQPDESPAD